MLFLPQSIYDRRQQLWRDFKSGKLTDEALYRKLLELEPSDYIGLVGTGKVLQHEGEFAQAEAHYWKAIQANPCISEPYLDLARMLYSRPDSHALAMGLSELAILKKSREKDGEDFLKDLNFGKIGLPGELLEEFKALPAPMRGELIVASMRQDGSDEPGTVTERLRPLRLIEELQKGEMDAEAVDSIIAEGSAIIPLLIGVLRAWAQDFLDEEGDSDVENALALLGEIGSPEEIPHLLEFVDLRNEIAAGAASWALGRIMERRPGESSGLIESMVPGLGMAVRLKIAEQTILYPGFDPTGKLLEQLSEHLGSMEKDDRDIFFSMLLVTMVTARGSAGVRLGRAVLRRQGGQLSKSGRRHCEDLLASCEEDGVPRTPAILPPPTVYEICAGEATWDEYGEDEEEMEDEFLPPPEPVRRRATPGRNDPCWCNSGKKYKKCHLDSDERESRQGGGEDRSFPSRENEFADLRRNIGEFLGEVMPRHEMKQAILEFFGDGPQDDETQLPLVDWIIHDRFSPSLGKTVLEEYLARHHGLTARERTMAEAWSRSFFGLYEVQQPKAGTGVELKDLIAGETFFVHDVNMSTRLVKWDGLLARVVPGERGNELTGAALTVPRTQLQRFREWMDGDREESGLEWREYLKGNWPRIRRQTSEIAANWLTSLQLANSDGEDILFSKATFTVRDYDAVLGALGTCPAFDDVSGPDESGTSFVWLNEQNAVLGNIRVGNGVLVLDTNSRARMERGKALIVELADNSLRHLRDEFTTQTDLKRGLTERPRGIPNSPSEIPKEVGDEIVAEALERHYAGWPDMKLPALDGKTPRQATKTPKGRLQLAELLKFIENGEERKRQRGEAFYDVARLRAELGIPG